MVQLLCYPASPLPRTPHTHIPHTPHAHIPHSPHTHHTQGSEVQSKADTVVYTVVTQVNQLCPSCSLTSNHITSAVFRCFPESPQAVTFRAHLHATSSTSSLTLLGHIRAWVDQGGVIPVNVVLTSLDGSCPLLISSLGDVECKEESSSLGAMSGVSVVLLGAGVAVGCVLLVLLVAVVLSAVLVLSLRRRHLCVPADTNWTKG